MKSETLKKSLIQMAGKVKRDTTVEDIYKQLAFLLDIEESEQQEKEGLVFSQKEVEKIAAKWVN